MEFSGSVSLGPEIKSAPFFVQNTSGTLQLDNLGDIIVNVHLVDKAGQQGPLLASIQAGASAVLKITHSIGLVRGQEGGKFDIKYKFYPN